MKHTKFWLEQLIAAMETEINAETRTRLLETCGRACAGAHVLPALERARATLPDVTDLDAVLAAMRKWGIGGKPLTREGNRIYGEYDHCYCPMREEGLAMAPWLCDCTCGWTKAVFETLLGHPVKVRLLQAIGRGDPVCRFEVEV